MQTPAPPGAWNGTPGFGSVGRKSALKVRFDVTSESEAPSSPGQQDISLESIEMVHPSDDDHAHPRQARLTGPMELGYDEPRSAFSSFSSSDTSGVDDGPRTPVLRPAPAPPRTPPSVRVVDAFGREVMRRESKQGSERCVTDDASIARCHTQAENHPYGLWTRWGGRFNRTEMRQNLIRLRRNCRERSHSLKMRESISSLAREMDDADLSSSSDDESDEARFKELNETSAKARIRGRNSSKLYTPFSQGMRIGKRNTGPSALACVRVFPW
jgi:hypothetical protein